ncbi:leucine-rich repeat domain-containing protein [Pseudobacteroides cellulosolvens]|nr:leucine-rich repeat domain-containing protein [Pseudobacteroides cellulosolvens]
MCIMPAEHAFKGCSSLTDIIMQKGVTSIEKDAICNCI